MDIMDLYFKRYRGSAEAKDYITWATSNLHKVSRNVKMLVGMSLTNHHNLFKIEEIFQKEMQELGLQIPSELDCVYHHVRKLHMKLLQPQESAILVVREIYQMAIAYELFDLQEEWQELSDVTDDYLSGKNSHAHKGESPALDCGVCKETLASPYTSASFRCVPRLKDYLARYIKTTYA